MNYDELIAAGFSHEEAVAYLRQNGGSVPTTPARAPSDVTSVRLPEGVAPAAAVAGGIYGIYQGTKAAGRGIANRETRRRQLRAVGEIPGSFEALLQRLQEFRATGRGADVTVSDLDPRLSAEADFAATNNPRARATLSAINTERRRAMPPRLLSDVERIAPGGYADAPGLQQQIQQEQQAFARSPEGYEGLRQQNPRINPEGAGRLAQFLNEPRTARLWQDAASVGAVGPLPPAEALSFEVLQGFKERLYGLKERAYRQGDGDLGNRLKAAYTELDGILDEAIPGYREVNARYRAYTQQQEALELGAELWRDQRMQLPELERRIAGLGPAERELLQKGMLGAYLTEIENNRQNSGFFEEMMTRLPVQQRKLEVVFGGKEGFQRALQTFEQEIAMARLGEVVGGSPTARRGAQQATTIAETAGDAAHVVTSPMTGIPAVASKGVSRWMPGAVAERMAPFATARGADDIERLLRALMKYR